MKKANLEMVRAALETLNSEHGIGSIRQVKLFLDGKGELIRHPYGMKPQKRKFRVLWGSNKVTVFAFGTQLTIKECTQ